MEIRLVGGPNLCSGRVEVFLSGQWASVCDDSWGIEEAMVVCRQLGCGSAVSATHEAQFGNGTVSIGLDDVRCRGTESALSECPASPWGEHDCSHEETAGVICSGGLIDFINFLLFLSDHIGKKTVFNSGTHNSRRIEKEDSCLLCLFTFSLLGQPWGSDPTHPTEIRLVDNCSGRVELLHHGEWGTICGDGWGIEEATVVCHEMGCGTGSMNQSRTWNGSGTSPIWLDGVHCRGTESSLFQCSASPLGRHGCDSGRTAFVVCSGKFINHEVRLIDGPTPCTGRVEVFHNKAWGTVCDNGWDLEDASVVCQEVGCGEALVAAIGARFGQGSGPIWMDEVNCTGKEKVLKKCPQEKSLSLTCDHRKDVGVECAGNREVRLMRLADGRHRCTGRVELFLDGQWRMCTGTETSFSECEITPWQDSDLDRLLPFYVVGVTCTAMNTTAAAADSSHASSQLQALFRMEPAPPPATSEQLMGASELLKELRLVNGSNYCSGRIEVFHNEMWGTICDAGWDLQDAQVVCRELGCGEALSASGGAQFGRGAGPIWLEGMSCTGTEESLRQCPKGQWGEHSCDHSRDASVECADYDELYDLLQNFLIFPSELRLVNGPNICSGHLEVLYNQQWGTVCDIGWDTHDAQVVCRELNCGDASKGFEGVRYGQGSGLIWLENVNCTGEEMSLTDCPKILPSDARLVNGPNRCSGRVELLHNQEWGTVCDASWDIYDAQVVCRELGCGNALKAFRGAHHGQGFGPIWIEGVNCTGKEASLSECNRSPWGEHHCSHSQDASVECTELAFKSMKSPLVLSKPTGTRLVNGTNRCSGRVEMFFNEAWGTVCDSGWDLREAQVVCRELDCGGALSAPGGSLFGTGKYGRWSYEPKCLGTEVTFQKCMFDSRHFCRSFETAGVVCSDLRLMNGTSPCSGRVEVFHNDTWGTICDAGWDLQDAQVICREKGCGNASKASGGAHHGQGSGPIWLESINCTGEEASLKECQKGGWGEHSCSHSQDASVECSETRLVNGPNRCSGRVEVLRNGVWGTVCDDGWDLSDAQVVCRELSCGGAVSAPEGAHFGKGNDPILINEVQCRGTEVSLYNCIYKMHRFHECRHEEDAGVVCSDLRLMNGTSPCSGRVEVFHNDTWGTICDAGWDLQDAQVVCSQLGCGKASKALGGAHYGQGSGPIWLENINCTGDESSLKECQKGIWGEHSCSHSQDASVECSGTCLPQVLFPGT
ncbi:deleted in malignant brain tumors 1 protein [Anolis carolinensis]|uniref:deleted in malignant brain tumors 1 protein n=1 Tax=Anolis carolinensis TaxID=28377 RepID=UPI002F2B452A